MKFNFERDALTKEILIAQEIINSSQSDAIMSYVLLTAENNTLTIKAIKATDKNLGFESSIPVDIIEEGSTIVFCSKFMDILKALPVGDVEFEQQESDDQKKTIKIRSISTKKIKFEIKAMSAEKFPVFNISEWDADKTMDLPAKELKNMINQTIFAVSKDLTRFFMTGVYFTKNENKLVLAATDGKRLSLDEKEFETELADFPASIVPTKILSIILKHAPDEGLITLCIKENEIFVKFGNYKFFSSLIKGQFPNYQRVIPENQPYNFQLQKADIEDALKRIALMSERESSKVFFNVKPGVLKITSKIDELGSADEEIPCQYDGEEITIALNYHYLEEPLKAINAERVRIEFSEALRALTLLSEPKEDFLHVIMPMQAE